MTAMKCSKSLSPVPPLFFKSAPVVSSRRVFHAIETAAGDLNVYDIREPCSYPPLCYDLSAITRYLNLPSTRRKLGVGDRQWQPCSAAAYAPFETKDFEYSYRFDLPRILKWVPVLIYNGDFDLVVDFYGTSEMLDTMEWPGQSGFLKASASALTYAPLFFCLAQYDAHLFLTENETWIVDGKAAGSVRSFAWLTYLIVNNAGALPSHIHACTCLALIYIMRHTCHFCRPHGPL